MKKLQTLAFYTLVTPAIALGSSALIAAESESLQDDQGITTSQQDSGVQNSAGSDPMTSGQSGKNDQSGMQGQQAGMESEDYMNSAPPNSMQASNVIGSDVKTTGDEKVGSISDLIIDEDGKVAAVLVGVGGFLGMGEKEVAISWDKVTKSGTGDKQELRIDQTRESLQNAPEFEKQKQQ